MPAYDELTLRGYLEEVGIRAPASDRIEQLVREYQILIDATPEFIFVENPVNSLGSIEFTNLILLTGPMYAEFSLNQPNRTVAFLNIRRNVTRIVMPTLRDLSFGNITDRSRLTIQIFKGTELIGFFAASGNNCADLIEMVKRYFIPALGD